MPPVERSSLTIAVVGTTVIVAIHAISSIDMAAFRLAIWTGGLVAIVLAFSFPGIWTRIVNATVPKRRSLLALYVSVPIAAFFVAYTILYPMPDALWPESDDLALGDGEFYYFWGKLAATGHNPYTDDGPHDIVFNSHGPLFSVICAGLVTAWDNPKSIHLFTIGIYLLLGPLSHHAARKVFEGRKKSEEMAIAASFLVMLSAYAWSVGCDWNDDDILLEFLFLLMFTLYVHGRYRPALATAVVATAIKHFAIVFYVIILLADRSRTMRNRAVDLLASVAILAVIYGFFTVLWGPAVYRGPLEFNDYTTCNAGLSLGVVLFDLGILADETIYTIWPLSIPLLLLAPLLVIAFKKPQKNVAQFQFNIVIATMFLMYLGTYFVGPFWLAWIAPFVIIRSVEYIHDASVARRAGIVVLLIAFDALLPLWTHYQWILDHSTPEVWILVFLFHAVAAIFLAIASRGIARTTREDEVKLAVMKSGINDEV